MFAVDRGNGHSWTKANPTARDHWGSALEVPSRSFVMDLGGPDAGDAPAMPSFVPTAAGRWRFTTTSSATCLLIFANTHLLGERLRFSSRDSVSANLGGHRAGSKRMEGCLQARAPGASDGVYFEQSLHYHVYALDSFSCRLLLRETDLEIPVEYESTLADAFGAGRRSRRLGPPEGFAMTMVAIFNSRRNRTEHMTDPTCHRNAALWPRRSFGGSPDGRIHLAVWTAGSRGLSKADVHPRRLFRLLSRMADLHPGRPRTLAQQMVVDAVRNGVAAAVMPRDALACGLYHGWQLPGS